MPDEHGSITELLERKEREYLLTNVRVKMRSSVENLDVGDLHFERLGQGESVELPRWVADEIVGQGMAETVESPFENEIFNALSKEKIMGPLQLSGMQPDFYMRMRRKLTNLGASVAEGKSRKEEYDRLRAVCYDLVGIRLSKLMSLSSSAAVATTLGDKLTPEESAFLSISQSLSKEWKAGLLGGK